MKYIDLKKYKKKRMSENIEEHPWRFFKTFDEFAAAALTTEPLSGVDVGTSGGNGSAGGAGVGGQSLGQHASRDVDWQEFDQTIARQVAEQGSYPQSSLDNNSTDASI